MIRSIALAAVLSAGLALPALAESPAHFGALFTHDQAREHLMRLGYTKVSQLEKDANGKWVGTAISKDGKLIPVAVDVKRAPSVSQ